MPEPVRSYVADQWWTPPSVDTDLVDAATGEPVAAVSSAGPDVAAALRHARTVGGPALRELTFPERAQRLRAFVKALCVRSDELYAESAKSGATLPDAKFDVDGGVNALAVYARKGAAELPNSTIYVDGKREQLSKNGTFAGQHIYTSRTGVAVFINAFNVPVWGMLEKFAPAFLAGLPVIVKPATQTSYITSAAVRLLAESQDLPPGALQLVVGRVDELLDGLDEQDSVAFTGSAATAQQLRSRPSLVSRGVRFASEADSLNCSILGPDADPDTDEFALFVRAVTGEVTLKAGQKCTAIRRAFVPAARLDAAVDAIVARLAKVVVGDPRDEATRMGPLVSRQQRDEVSSAVDRLAAECELVLGAGELRLGSGDPERGAFLAPTVLVDRDATAQVVHDVEAFGPVVSVVPYSDADDAVRLAALGRGSLVGSIVSNDAEFVHSVVRGVAPYHGRLLLLDRDDAAEATPHGAALPHLVHGGPGRAGGGEELGGVRAVLHNMQITALSGSPGMIDAVLGADTTR